jgi:phosphoglycolate phosphatase
VLLALWDIDGTLVDSAGHGRYAFEAAFQSVVGGKPAVRVEMAGRTDHQIALEMLGGDDRHLRPMLDELAAALDQRRALIAEQGHPYPGVPEALAALHDRDDVVQSLLTGNIQLNAALKVEAFGLERWLDYDVGAYGSDPHVERADLVAVARQRAADKYGELTGAVLIGDTPLDVAAARSAGARAVAVATGFSTVEALHASGADAVLADLSDTDAAVAAILGE